MGPYRRRAVRPAGGPVAAAEGGKRHENGVAARVGCRIDDALCPLDFRFRRQEAEIDRLHLLRMHGEFAAEAQPPRIDDVVRECFRVVQRDGDAVDRWWQPGEA